MDNNTQIEGGAFQVARKLFESELWRNKPSTWKVIWIYILGRVNHKADKICERGEGFFQWNKEIGLVGKDINPHIIKSFCRYARNCSMITSRRTTRGVYIKVFNYNIYQTLNNYLTSTKNTAPTTKKQLRNNLETSTIDKNVKNERMERSSGVPPQEVQQLIGLFKSVNPSYERLFANKTERGSAGRLISKFGLKKMVDTLTELPRIIILPYAPRITTPYELEKNLGKLITFVEQNKSITKKSEIAFI